MSADFDARRWVADRMHQIEGSAIRKMFELVRTLKDPINLSIGQPEWDVPEPIKAAAWEAIQSGNNGYTLTAGFPPVGSPVSRNRRPKASSQTWQTRLDKEKISG